MDHKKRLPFTDNEDRLQKLEEGLKDHPVLSKVNNLAKEYELPEKSDGTPLPRVPFIGINLDTRQEENYREDMLTIFKQEADRESNRLLEQYWRDQAALLELGNRYQEAMEVAPDEKSKFYVWADVVDKFIDHHFHYVPRGYRQQLKEDIFGEGNRQIMQKEYGLWAPDLAQF